MRRVAVMREGCLHFQTHVNKYYSIVYYYMHESESPKVP